MIDNSMDIFTGGLIVGVVLSFTVCSVSAPRYDSVETEIEAAVRLQCVDVEKVYEITWVCKEDQDAVSN